MQSAHEYQILVRQNLSKKLSAKEEEIKLVTKELYMKLYIKESLKIDQQKIEHNINKAKREIEEIKDLLCLHYHKILKDGKDTRCTGLIWVIKAIWLIEKEILLSYLPKFIDRQLISYLFQVAHKEIELHHSNELTKEIKEIIVFNRGLRLRNSGCINIFKSNFIVQRQKELLEKMGNIKESLYGDSLHNASVLMNIFNEDSKGFEMKELNHKNIRDLKKNLNREKNKNVDDSKFTHIKNTSSIPGVETNFSSKIGFDLNVKQSSKRKSYDNLLKSTVNLASQKNLSPIKETIISNTLQKQINQVEDEVKPKLENINKDNIIDYLVDKDLLDDDTKYLLDYVRTLDKLKLNIRNNLLQMKDQEIKRISKEFFFNNYEKQYGVGLETILSIIVGEDNLTPYMKIVERERKDYNSKMSMIRIFNPFGNMKNSS